MSESEKLENIQYVELTAFQQLNDPQSSSTVSTNGVGAVIRTQDNEECDFRRTAGELERTKTSIFDRCQHLEIVLLAVVILVVLIVLLLPIVFYHLPSQPVSYEFCMSPGVLSMLVRNHSTMSMVKLH